MPGRCLLSPGVPTNTGQHLGMNSKQRESGLNKQRPSWRAKFMGSEISFFSLCLMLCHGRVATWCPLFISPGFWCCNGCSHHSQVPLQGHFLPLLPVGLSASGDCCVLWIFAQPPLPSKRYLCGFWYWRELCWMNLSGSSCGLQILSFLCPSLNFRYSLCVLSYTGVALNPSCGNGLKYLKGQCVFPGSPQGTEPVQAT